MIQAGDPASRHASDTAALGSGDTGYTIPAEFVYPRHFHRRGALSAAREDDDANPEKESSGCQFFIVTGKTFNEAGLDDLESQMNRNMLHSEFNRLARRRMKEISAMREVNDSAGLKKLQDELTGQTEKTVLQNPFRFTKEQRDIYKTEGGAPHLDGQYTVFGEVIEGMDAVYRIQNAKTDRADRPRENIAIKKITVEE